MSAFAWEGLERSPCRARRSRPPRRVAAGRRTLDSLIDIRMDVPLLMVDTSDGDQPGIGDIPAFITQPAGSSAFLLWQRLGAVE